MKKYALYIILSFLSLTVSAHTYRMSNAGKESIKKHESCKLTAYWDMNGYSIGYGHHTKEVKKGMKISQRQAEKYFDEDIKKVEAIANRILKKYNYKFSQGFFDGLCDLIYNCGEGGVKRSEFYKRLNKCRISKGKMNQSDLRFTVAAVRTMKLTAPGHKARRLATHKLMLS